MRPRKRRKQKVSEVTTPDQEPDQEQSDASNSEDRDASGTNEDVNPALQKAPNPEGDPEDDRMGAPAVMPD
jgi:hypothetical protein